MIYIEYKYFVAYSHKLGVGNIELISNYRINNYGCIKRMNDYIEQEAKLTDDFKPQQVVITNYKLLSWKIKFKRRF